MLKLMNLIESIREILKYKQVENMKLLVSKVMRERTRPIFPDITSDALHIGKELFSFYLHPYNSPKDWNSITEKVKEFSRNYSDLQPLLEYYLVTPPFFLYRLM